MPAMPERLSPQPASAWTVVCLCADWCGTCRDYRRAFEQRARQRDDAMHIWLDIEDDSDWLGDLDVETFPRSASTAPRAIRCRTNTARPSPA